MTRTEAIAMINERLTSLDDASVMVVADIIEDISVPDPVLRQLSERERALLGQSNNDFQAGRTYSHEELVSKLDGRLALRGVPKSSR